MQKWELIKKTENEKINNSWSLFFIDGVLKLEVYPLGLEGVGYGSISLPVPEDIKLGKRDSCPGVSLRPYLVTNYVARYIILENDKKNQKTQYEEFNDFFK